jgi:plastocyanin
MKLLKLFPVACLAILASCGGSSSTAPYNGGGTTPPPGNGGGTTSPGCTPGNGTVCLVDGNRFDPSTLTIGVGGTVTFNNVSGTTHNVTFTTTGSPDNVADFASGTHAVTFSTAGTYNYHCTIHGASMSGVVVVQ